MMPCDTAHRYEDPRRCSAKGGAPKLRRRCLGLAALLEQLPKPVIHPYPCALYSFKIKIFVLQVLGNPMELVVERQQSV